MRIIKPLKRIFLGEGVELIEGETSTGQSCSLHMKRVGNKLREISHKIGDNGCLDALKKKLKEEES